MWSDGMFTCKYNYRLICTSEVMKPICITYQCAWIQINMEIKTYFYSTSMKHPLAIIVLSIKLLPMHMSR